MKLLTSSLIVLCLTSLAPSTARAITTDLHIPNFTGEDSTPGFPGAMNVQSLTIVPQGFSVIKKVDTASPQIFQAVVNGTHLSDAHVLLYNSTPSGPPDATLTLLSPLGTAYQNLGGNTPMEKDTFSTATPASMYLQLSGITGESATPGYPGIMQIQSFLLAASQFTIDKHVDSASPTLFQDLLQGNPLAAATLLFYNSAPVGPPDTLLLFHSLLISADQSLPGGDIPSEQVTFSFQSVSQPTPEPATAALLFAGVGFLYPLQKRRRHPIA